MSQNGHHANAPADARSRRNRIIALVAIVGGLALVVGFLLGSRGGNDDDSPSATPAATSTPTPDPEPTDGPSPDEPSATDTPSASPSEQPTGGAPLDEGTHFVLAERVVEVDGGDALVLDLAYFLTGDDANAAAAEAGDETPVPNDYYIVNDNPKLRTVPIAPDAAVSYIPSGSCCDLQTGDLSAWIDTVNGAVQSDYPDMGTTWWWVTVQGGEIVAIEQQYLP